MDADLDHLKVKWLVGVGCKLRKAVFFLFISQTLMQYWVAIAEGIRMENRTFQLCTGAESLNFNPYRGDISVKEIQVLRLLTRPILGDSGIVEALHFSADGKEMTARIKNDLVFVFSGKKVDAKVVAYGISILFRLRVPARGIWVTGTENLTSDVDWYSKKIKGIEVLDANTFKLRFETKPGIENVPGVVRELLERQSAGAKSTFWIADPAAPDDFVSKYAVIRGKDNIRIATFGKEIEIRPRNVCHQPDFYDHITSDGFSNFHGFNYSFSENGNTGLAFFNTKSLSMHEREFLASRLRLIAKTLERDVPGLKASKSHVEKGELGYSDYINWGEIKKEHSDKMFRNSSLRVLFHSENALNESFKKELTKLLAQLGVKAIYDVRSGESPVDDYDVFLIRFPMTKGRQKWMQGAVPNLGLAPLLKGAPLTSAALQEGQRSAASTVPVNTDVISSVEKSTFSEKSIIPIYRQKSVLFSRKSLPLVFEFDKNDEPIFMSKESQ
jgi:hypothetical protein